MWNHGKTYCTTWWKHVFWLLTIKLGMVYLLSIIMINISASSIAFLSPNSSTGISCINNTSYINTFCCRLTFLFLLSHGAFISSMVQPQTTPPSVVGFRSIQRSRGVLPHAHEHGRGLPRGEKRSGFCWVHPQRPSKSPLRFGIHPRNESQPWAMIETRTAILGYIINVYFFCI